MRIRLKNIRYVIIIAIVCFIGYRLFQTLSAKRIKEAILRYRQERYEAAQNRGYREGPGENGEGVELAEDEKKIAQERAVKASFNVYAAEKIAMDRSIPDTRRKECRDLSYLFDLPTISAIMIFNNEAVVAILRTAHSIINRTPPQYLKEVILLDDFSSNEDLKENLDKLVAKTWPDGIVKVVRRESRGGLVKARVSGARAASGDTIIIMDAHMEVNVGWAEPILHYLKEHPTHMVVPVVDNIRDTDLKYTPGNDQTIQGFTWSMLFWWMPTPKRLLAEQNSPTDPIKSFAMVGCVFAMNREAFFQYGAFDEGMSIWGAENVELPLRLWMCGSAVYVLPCSRIGHLFRKTHPFTFVDHDAAGYNAKRTAEVWLDDYKRLFYLQRPTNIDRDVGDLSERKAIRERLRCHSFKWFLQNIYLEKFIPDENVLAYGLVENEASGLCIDNLGKRPIDKGSLQMNTCRGERWKQNQQLSLSKKNEFRVELMCYERSVDGSQVKQNKCADGVKEHHTWHYNKVTHELKHDHTGHCLDAGENKVRAYLAVKPCNGSDEQKWKWTNLYF